jgi:hypothetical protein
VPPTYAYGQIVLHRGFNRDELHWVTANRVVLHDHRGLLLWRAPGAAFATRFTADGRLLRDMTLPEWASQRTELRVRPWHGPSVLTLVRPGRMHSVWWWFRDGLFDGWYVNLEQPSVLWGGGVDFSDQDLDLVVNPDRTWSWKDEHELASRLAHPESYWVPDPAAVREEGERVIEDVEAGRFPFDGTWCDLETPDWPVPEALPDGWDRPRQR